MNRDDLKRLSKDELIEMGLRLQCPSKTSLLAAFLLGRDGAPRERQVGWCKPGHMGHFRTLHDDPYETVEDVDYRSRRQLDKALFQQFATCRQKHGPT